MARPQAAAACAGCAGGGGACTGRRTAAAVRTPDGDGRRYAVVALCNGLQAVVVSDPETDKAAAALDVHVGHMCDPDAVPGLAHFCEHLLFLGTEKYPVENDYSEFLSGHGGYSNAFTVAENTNYFFDVAADHLEGALDRFAQFFICPLFSESCTEREINAVDSEFKASMQLDAWRAYQLERDLSNPKHPFRKFGTGNIATLKDGPARDGIDIRQVLLEFHSKYYSANIMRLCVLGKEPVDQLIDWVTSKFSAIKNKNIAVPSFSDDALTESELGKEIHIKAVQQMRQLTITFPFPDTRENYKARPMHYLSHLLGHEGKGSILSLLKKRGWAQSLTAGSNGLGARGFDFFPVSIELTESGLENYEQVAKIVFEYIEMVKTSPINEHIVKECQVMAELGFRFEEKSPPSMFVSFLAGNQHIYEPEDVISGAYLWEHFDEAATRACVQALQPNRCRVVLHSSSFDDAGWQQAEHYGTSFFVCDFSEKLQEIIAHIKPNPELFLPDPNVFIPSNFTVDKMAVVAPLEHPHIIAETQLLRLWHKKDDTFFVPKANVLMTLGSPIVYESAEACTKTRLFVDLFKDSLNELSYYASLAGVGYALDTSLDGLSLSVYGFSDKIDLLLETVVSKLKTFVVNQAQFVRIKEQLEKEYQNFDNAQPYEHADYYSMVFSQERLFLPPQKLAALQTLDVETVMQFGKQILDVMHVQMLVHGNMDREHALRLSDIVLKHLQPYELHPSLRFRTMRLHLLEEGNVPNAQNLNSAIDFRLQLGEGLDIEARNLTGLIDQITQEPVFDQLRTKEQLGYTVFSSIDYTMDMVGLKITLQSERDPAYLESRVEAFLQKFEDVLEAMPQEDFEKHRAALITKILEKLKNLGEEAGRLWEGITNQSYFFDQRKVDAEQVATITKQQVLDFYRSKVSPGAPGRRKLSIHMRSQVNGQTTDADGEAVLARSTVLDSIDAVREFRSKLKLSDYTKPVRPIETWLA